MKAKLLQKMYKAVTFIAISDTTREEESDDCIEILSRGEYESNIDKHQIQTYRKMEASIPVKKDQKIYLSSTKNMQMLQFLDRRLVSRGAQDAKLIKDREAKGQKLGGNGEKQRPL